MYRYSQLIHPGKPHMHSEDPGRTSGTGTISGNSTQQNIDSTTPEDLPLNRLGATRDVGYPSSIQTTLVHTRDNPLSGRAPKELKKERQLTLPC